MANAPAHPGQDPQYELFLHASFGDDRRGASVAVLSMFDRLGVDPWREAADLASLPVGAARKRLGALIARFTDVPSFGPARSDPARRTSTGASRSDTGSPMSVCMREATGTILWQKGCLHASAAVKECDDRTR